MNKRKTILTLLVCYLLWGFQPLYWSLEDGIDSLTILGCRIIMAAAFSCLILAASHRLPALQTVFHDRKTMKILLPATLFLLLDWGVFILAVNTGHVLDTSLGYYINPLLIFAIGTLLYKERCDRVQIAALSVAVIGILVSTVAYDSFPYISVIIASNWAVYTALKKNVQLDGVLSIAAETLLLTPFAITFLLVFRHAELAAMSISKIAFLIGSGVVTALPMYLYNNSINAFPLIVMCFAQYLSPSFNMLCGLLLGEHLSSSQRSSLVFFLLAIIVFTVDEVRQYRKAS